MEGLTISPKAVEAANRKIAQLIENLRSPQESFSVIAEQMAAVLTEVVRVGESTRINGVAVTAPQSEGTVVEELNRYRSLLEQLRTLLPELHAHLLTERSRLQAERLHLDSAAAWARSAARHAR